MTAYVDNEGVRVQPAPACPLCAREGPVLYDKLRDRLFSAAGVWNLRQCGACDLLWIDPRPVSADVGKLYLHYLTHNPPPEPSRFGRHLRQGILAGALGYPIHGSRLGRVLALLPPVRNRIAGTMMWLRADWKGRLLDVGCGNGEFLARARGLGWDVGGIEPDPTASQVARNSGIPILASRLDEAALPAESFDAITLSHVVEHLLEPVATLRHCARVLKPGGRLVLATPNTHSLGHSSWRKNWVGLDPPRHIILFSPRALRRCAEEASLQVAELRTVSRFASWMWAASRGIRRRGHFPLENLRHRGLLGWAESLTAMSFESLTTPFFHSGEEIVLIATRAPAR